MPIKHITLSVLAACFLVTLLLRQHIRDLVDCARTYAYFDRYLDQHPHAVLKYPSPYDVDEARDAGLAGPVPKIIHQVFLWKGMMNVSLDSSSAARKSCQVLHPDWQNYLWTDANASTFLQDYYPSLLPDYFDYSQTIQRANILRYAVLHHYGGVYIDLDVSCQVAFDELLPAGSQAQSLAHLPWLTPAAYPAGVNNAFILSRPQHPFLTLLLSRVPSRRLSWGLPYVENMLSTGCMFMSNTWMVYTAGLSQQGAQTGVETRREDRVYVLADDKGRTAPQMLRGHVETSLFIHAGASSWHGWDAAAILLLGRHYRFFLAVAFVGVLVGIHLSRSFFSRFARLRRRSSSSNRRSSSSGLLPFSSVRTREKSREDM